MEQITIKILSNRFDFEDIKILMKNSQITFDVEYHFNTSVTGTITGFLPDLFNLFFKAGALSLSLLNVDYEE